MIAPWMLAPCCVSPTDEMTVPQWSLARKARKTGRPFLDDAQQIAQPQWSLARKARKTGAGDAHARAVVGPQWSLARKARKTLNLALLDRASSRAAMEPGPEGQEDTPNCSTSGH